MSIFFRSLFLFFISIFFAQQAKSQISWYGTAGFSTNFIELSTCTDTTYTVYIQNTTANPISSCSLSVVLPSAISFISNSITETTVGNASKNPVLNGISTTSNLLFNFNTLNGGENVSFSFRVHTTCNNVTSGSVSVPIILTYNGGSTSSPVVGGNALTINIIKPVISAINQGNANIGAVGATFTQCDTFLNSGFGALDFSKPNVKAFLILDSAGKGLTIGTPAIGNYANDTIAITAAMIASIGNGNTKWETNEKLIICYPVTINSCILPLNRLINIWWGCDNTICEAGIPNPINIPLNSQSPQLVRRYRVSKSCFDGALLTDTIVIKNTGLNTATNLQILLSNYIPGSGAEPAVFDTTSFVVRKSNGSMIGIHNTIPTNTVNYNSCFANTNFQSEVEVYFPNNILIIPGDSIFFIYKQKKLNWCSASGPASFTNCAGVCPDGIAFNFEANKIKYTDQCNLNNYLASLEAMRSAANNATGGPNYLYFSSTLGGPTDASNGDIVGLNFDYNFLRFSNTASYTATLKIIVPKCYTLSGQITYNTDSILSSYQIVDTLYIPLPDYMNAYSTSHNLNIPFLLTCASNCSGVFKISHIYNLNTPCNANCKLELGCRTWTITPHCAQPCTKGGITPYKVVAKRISYGLPDNNNDQLPDASGSLDFSKIKLNRITQGDTMLFAIDAVVYHNTITNTDFNHCYGQISFANGTIDYLKAMPNAVAIIKPNAGGAAISTTLNLTKVSAGVWSYNLDNSTIINWGGIGAGGRLDSVKLNIKFVFDTINYNYPGYAFIQNCFISNDMYSSYIANPILAIDKYSCDQFNSAIDFYHWGYDEYTPQNQLIQGCDSRTLYTYSRFDIGSNNQDNVFPFEYRGMSISDTMIMHLPPGYDYEPNSGNFSPDNCGGLAGCLQNFPPYGPYSINFPINPVSIIGNNITGTILKFYVGSLFTANGGTIKPADESYWDVLSIRVLPRCDYANSTIDQLNVRHTIKSTTYNLAKCPAFSFDDFYGASYLYTYGTVLSNSTKTNLSGGGLYNIFGDSVTATLSLSNISSNLPVYRNWIYIKKLSGPGNYAKLKYKGVTISANANGFFELDSLQINSSNGVNIDFYTGLCDTSKFLVYTGHSCLAYPTSLDTSNLCQPPIPITILPNEGDAEVQMYVLYNGPNNTVNFCDTFFVETTISSNQLGDITNLFGTYTIPAGYYIPQISAIQIEYPVGSGYRAPTNFSQFNYTGGFLYVNMNGMDAQMNNGLSGVYDITKNVVKLKIPFVPACFSLSGEFIRLNFQSQSKCGTPIPNIIKETNPIVFTQLGIQPYSTNISFTGDTVTSCADTNLNPIQATIRINSFLNQLTDITDSIYVILPPGTSMAPYNAAAIGNINAPTIGPLGPQLLANNTKKYSWAMPPSIGNGDSVRFTFNYIFDYISFDSCNQPSRQLVIKTVYLDSVNCNNYSCSILGPTGNNFINITFDLPVLTATSNSDFYCGNTSVFKIDSITLCNSANSPVLAGTPTTIEYFCDANNNNTFDAGDTYLGEYITNVFVPAAGCAIISGLNISINNVCAMNKKIFSVIKRNPTIQPEQCVCDNSFTTTNKIFYPYSDTTILDTICQGQSANGYTNSGNYIDTFNNIYGCDSIVHFNLYVKLKKYFTINNTICNRDTFLNYTTSGTHIDTFVSSIGCDSIRTINLIVNPTHASIINLVGCTGDVLGGLSATGQNIIVYQNQYGCDSTITYNVTINPVVRDTVRSTICQGENTFGYTATGTYIDVFNTYLNCDSIRTLILKVNPILYLQIDTGGCPGFTFLGHSTTGTYIDTFTSITNCDSIRTVNITIYPSYQFTFNKTICQGNNYAGYTLPGTYLDTFNTIRGCDSIRTINLSVIPTTFGSITRYGCKGQSILGRTTTGVYFDTLVNANGCDSVRTLLLYMQDTFRVIKNVNICLGDSTWVGNGYVKTNGTYYQNLTTNTGCDSIIEYRVVVQPLADPFLGAYIETCESDSISLYPGNYISYLWSTGQTTDSIFVKQTGIYWVKVIDEYGCKGEDSVLLRYKPQPNIILRVNTQAGCFADTVQLFVSGADKYIWKNNGDIVSYDSTYTFLLNTSNVIIVKGYYGFTQSCFDEDTLMLSGVYCCNPLIVPNVFTPNGDTKNDVFKPVNATDKYEYYNFKIFNRWGNEVFSTANQYTGWNGKNSSGKLYDVDTYFYMIQAKCFDTKKIEFLKGDVLLTR
jgi:gliding motility-associated-like protein